MTPLLRSQALLTASRALVGSLAPRAVVVTLVRSWPPCRHASRVTGCLGCAPQSTTVPRCAPPTCHIPLHSYHHHHHSSLAPLNSALGSASKRNECESDGILINAAMITGNAAVEPVQGMRADQQASELELMSPTQDMFDDLMDIFDTTNHDALPEIDTATITQHTTAPAHSADDTFQQFLNTTTAHAQEVVAANSTGSDSDQDTQDHDDTQRYWNMTQCDAAHVLPHKTHLAAIYVKNKRAKESQQLSEKVYSTLKYELTMRLTEDMLVHDVASGKPAFIQAHVVLMDARTNLEVLEDGDKNPALTGELRAFLAQNGAHFDGKLVVQVSKKLSHHRKPREFYLRVFFHKSDNTNAFLTMDSAQFKVYARKPNKKNYGQAAKKRKRELEETVGGSRKRAKKTSKKMDKFMLALEKMLKCKQELEGEEEELALNLCLTKLKSAKKD